MINTSTISNIFDVEAINSLAFTSGLIKRVRKITGFDLVISLLYAALEQVPSYNTLSIKMFSKTGKDVSRQRLHKIISSEVFFSFFSSFLTQIWNDRIIPQASEEKGKFKRVILQDSTILQLPKRLFAQYSGVSNGIVSSANCRVQVCVDLMTNLLQTLSIDSYSINDLKARFLITPNKGDLVIRDRGYSATEQLFEFLNQGIHFIVRHRSNNIYYNQSGKRIDLIKELSKRKTTVLMVRLNKPDAPLLTLFAQRVNQTITAQRQRASKLSRKGRKPSKLNLDQLNWSIYLTDLSRESYTFSEIWKLYSLRWRIEIIFKALKTHLNLDSIQNVSSRQLQIIIHARIAVVLLITVFVYNPLQKETNKNYPGKKISLLKLIGNIVCEPNQMFEIMALVKRKKKRYHEPEIIKLIKTSFYESRNRKNYEILKNQNILC